MKDTGNDMIEEAFFILKPGSDKGLVSEKDLVKHANTILTREAYGERFSALNMNVMSGKTKKGDFASFWCGVVVGAIVAAGVIFII